MDNNLFCKSFRFSVFSRKCGYHTDNSSGIDCNFIARMRRGRAVIESEQCGRLEAVEGEIFLLPFGLKYHSYWSADRGLVEFESYRFDFYPLSGGRRFKLQKLSPTDEETRILDLLAEDMTVTPLSVGRLFTFFGAQIPRLFVADEDPRTALYSMAREYIAGSSELKVPELARYLGMSESSVYAFFRSFGKTPVGLKNEMLVERAIALLSSTDLSVEEICGRVGFGSAPYFRKTLRRLTGKTPLEIRRDASLSLEI